MAKLSHREHLLAVFGTIARIELLEGELTIVARHHTELAEHLRAQLAAGAYDEPHGFMSASGAARLAALHETDAANSTAMAAIVNAALNPDLDQEDNQ
jgi:hypothetical protein